MINPEIIPRGYKQDSRPQLNGWCDGEYLCHCQDCMCGFVGDKRAFQYADCAYKAKDDVVISAHMGYL